MAALASTGLLLPPVSNDFDPSVSGLYGIIGAVVATADGATGAWRKTGTADTAWTPIFKKLALAAASASYLDMAVSIPENQGFVVKFERIGITSGGAAWSTLRLNEKAVSKTPSGSVITCVAQMATTALGEWDGRACMAGDGTYTNGISKLYFGRALDGRRQVIGDASHGYSYQYCARFTGVVLVGAITHVGIGVTNLKQGAKIVVTTSNDSCLW